MSLALALTLSAPLALGPPSPAQGSSVEVRFKFSNVCAPENLSKTVFIEATSTEPVLCSGFDLVVTWDDSKLDFISGAAASSDWNLVGFPFFNGAGEINNDTKDGDHMFSVRNESNPVLIDGKYTIAALSFLSNNTGDIAIDQSVGVLSTVAYGNTPSVTLNTLAGPPMEFKAAPNSPALETIRLGTPPNANALRSSLTTGPVTGSIWDPYIDHTEFAPNSVLDLLVASTISANDPGPGFTLLIGLINLGYFIAPAPGEPFQIPVSGDCSLIGAQVYTQGASLLPNGEIVGCNALDITLGNS